MADATMPDFLSLLPDHAKSWTVVIGLNVVACALTVAFCLLMRSIFRGRRERGGSGEGAERAYKRLQETGRYDTEKLRLAKVHADEETLKREAEVAKLKKQLADAGIDEGAHEEWMNQQQAHLDLAERMLANSRREAGMRAAAYRAAVVDATRIPDLETLMEEGVAHGSGHGSIKAPIPSYAYLEEPKLVAGTMTAGRVKVTNETAPPGEARAGSPRTGAAARDPIGWGSNVYVMPAQLDLPKEQRASSWRNTAKLWLRTAASAWTSPSMPDPSIPADKPKALMPPRTPMPPPSPPLLKDHSVPAFASRAAAEAATESPPSTFVRRQPTSMHVHEYKGDVSSGMKSNIMGHMKLKATDLDTLPELIRAALDKRHVRVVDLFRALDDDNSGRITSIEWHKAMREMGLQAPPDAVAAVFASFDPDKSGTIEYKELHKLLIRSIQRHPRLEGLKTKEATSIASRRKAGIAGHHYDKEEVPGVDRPKTAAEVLRDTLKDQMKVSLSRLVDLFKRIDEDGSKKISPFEFIQALREYGDTSPPEAIVAVFNSLDTDHDGQIDYNELEKLMRHSLKSFPILEPLPLAPNKAKK